MGAAAGCLYLSVRAMSSCCHITSSELRMVFRHLSELFNRINYFRLALSLHRSIVVGAIVWKWLKFHVFVYSFMLINLMQFKYSSTFASAVPVVFFVCLLISCFYYIVINRTCYFSSPFSVWHLFSLSFLCLHSFDAPMQADNYIYALAIQSKYAQHNMKCASSLCLRLIFNFRVINFTSCSFRLNTFVICWIRSTYLLNTIKLLFSWSCRVLGNHIKYTLRQLSFFTSKGLSFEWVTHEESVYFEGDLRQSKQNVQFISGYTFALHALQLGVDYKCEKLLFMPVFNPLASKETTEFRECQINVENAYRVRHRFDFMNFQMFFKLSKRTSTFPDARLSTYLQLTYETYLWWILLSYFRRWHVNITLDVTLFHLSSVFIFFSFSIANSSCFSSFFGRLLKYIQNFDVCCVCVPLTFRRRLFH